VTPLCSAILHPKRSSIRAKSAAKACELLEVQAIMDDKKEGRSMCRSHVPLLKTSVILFG
jgi:hypothetical protein